MLRASKQALTWKAWLSQSKADMREADLELSVNYTNQQRPRGPGYGGGGEMPVPSILWKHLDVQKVISKL
jgi:hypothetical protein